MFCLTVVYFVSRVHKNGWSVPLGASLCSPKLVYIQENWIFFQWAFHKWRHSVKMEEVSLYVTIKVCIKVGALMGIWGQNKACDVIYEWPLRSNTWQPGLKGWAELANSSCFCQNFSDLRYSPQSWSLQSLMYPRPRRSLLHLKQLFKILQKKIVTTRNEENSKKQSKKFRKQI